MSLERDMSRRAALNDTASKVETEFFIDKLLVRIHVTIEMIWYTGLAPWEFELSFPGSLIATFAVPCWQCR